jgi:hypothetical protein
VHAIQSKEQTGVINNIPERFTLFCDRDHVFVTMTAIIDTVSLFVGHEACNCRSSKRPDFQSMNRVSDIHR